MNFFVLFCTYFRLWLFVLVFREHCSRCSNGQQKKFNFNATQKLAYRINEKKTAVHIIYFTCLCFCLLCSWFLFWKVSIFILSAIKLKSLKKKTFVEFCETCISYHMQKNANAFFRTIFFSRFVVGTNNKNQLIDRIEMHGWWVYNHLPKI